MNTATTNATTTTTTTSLIRWGVWRGIERELVAWSTDQLTALLIGIEIGDCIIERM